MIVVDTSAIIALLEREADAKLYEDAIGKGDPSLISAVSVLEASIVLAGRRGDRASWDELIELPELEIRPHDATLTLAAREAFLRFGKGRHPAKLNFGDCAADALAKSEGYALLFKGNDFAQTDVMAAV